ncbi:hypothetical protein Rs2_08336 [Raphanus sativus]|nr:Uncharacterized protein Rs2_47929 [Raphanus sativus]KAJ4913715.1 hypothetical protein Rs2_08336 [Raphanus sativus]
MAKQQLHSRSSRQSGVETLLRQGSFVYGKLAIDLVVLMERYSHIYVAQAAGQEDPQNMAFHNASQMVGKTFTFQLKLTDFNLSASISLSQSHAYLIPTITHHFLILLIRSGQLKRLHARSWF